MFRYLQPPPHLLKLIIAVALIATAQGSWAATAGFECVSGVQSYSNREKMAAGDFSPSVLWHAVQLSPASIGYGPSGNREDEVTIVDGTVYMAHPTPDGTVTVNTRPNPDKGQAMLQLASPEAWKDAGTIDEIGSFDDLNFVLDDQADELECGDDVLLPFKIVGHANRITWSLDTQPKHLVQESSDQDVVIVGIYNRNQKEKLFMVRGYNIHAHVLMKGLKIAGHLRDLDLAEGATLWLPVR